MVCPFHYKPCSYNKPFLKKIPRKRSHIVYCLTLSFNLTVFWRYCQIKGSAGSIADFYSDWSGCGVLQIATLRYNKITFFFLFLFSPIIFNNSLMSRVLITMSMTYPTLLIKFITYPKMFESDLLYFGPYTFWYFVHFPSKFLYIYWFCKRSDFSFLLCVLPRDLLLAIEVS